MLRIKHGQQNTAPTFAPIFTDELDREVMCTLYYLLESYSGIWNLESGISIWRGMAIKWSQRIIHD